MKIEERVRLLDAAFKKAKAADYATALEEFEFLETQSEHPKDIAPLRLFQASCLTDMRKAAEALDRIRSVDQRQLGFANLVVFEFEYARILRALGDREDALKRTRNALGAIDTADDKQPTEVVARNLHTLLGILLAQLERCDEAIPVLEQVPIEDEGWADARLHLGDCKYGQSRYREAVEVYKSVISREKEVHPIFFYAALRNIGCAFYYLEEYAKTVEYLTKVEDQYDAYPDIKKELFSFLASSYLHLGNPSQARRYQYPSSGSQLVQ